MGDMKGAIIGCGPRAKGHAVGFEEATGVECAACADLDREHLPVISINVEGLDATEMGGKLAADYNIACRAGLHCAPRVHETLGTVDIQGTVRFSLGPFNTREHVEKTVAAVAEIAETAHKKGN